MFRRSTCLAALAAGLLALSAGPTAAEPEKKVNPAEAAKAKKALQEVQDFIGLWDLNGTQKAGNRVEGWKEKVTWSWKFKDGDAWITVTFAEGKGKHFKSGELRYDVPKKKYVLTLVPADGGAAQVFTGDYARGALRVDRKDAKTKDVYRVVMGTAAEGIRFNFKYEKQDGGKGLFSDVYALNGNKDGESLAGTGSKKPECVVSGGSANIAVQYNGKTYYVCCSGCRDEFLANPKKYAK